MDVILPHPFLYYGCMRDDEISRLLAELNPWWRAAATGGDPTAWAKSNRLLRDRDKHDLGYRNTVLNDVNMERVSDRLVVLTGPRRIGKSVVLLDSALALCGRQDLDPRQIIYVSCDGFTPKDLRRLFALARNLTRSIDNGGEQPRVWLLDEVSMISGWTKVLKAERDNGPVGDDTVVATGSCWNENDDVTGYLLAGRAGTTNSRRLRHVFPMTFRSFLQVTRPSLALIDSTHPALLQTNGMRDELEAVRFDIDAYDLAWQSFLHSGGFPRAVAEYEATGAISYGYMKDLEAWLHRDIDLAGSQQSIPLLLGELTKRATSPLNVQSTATALNWDRRTLDRRLQRLANSFGAVYCHKVDDRGNNQQTAQSKLYLTDPVLSWLPSALRAGLDTPDFTTLTEMSLGNALARTIDQLEEGRWSNGDTIGYAKTQSNKEVDLAPIPVATPSGTALSTPIESKWVDNRSRSEAKVMENKYGNGVLATKSILDMEHPTWAIPAPLVALMLE